MQGRATPPSPPGPEAPRTPHPRLLLHVPPLVLEVDRGARGGELVGVEDGGPVPFQPLVDRPLEVGHLLGRPEDPLAEALVGLLLLGPVGWLQRPFCFLVVQTLNSSGLLNM